MNSISLASIYIPQIILSREVLKILSEKKMNVCRKLGGEDRVWYITIWSEARLSGIYFLCVELGLILVSESLFDFGILLVECWTYRCRGSDRTLSCSITIAGDVRQ